jgi:hypothetical protein
MMKLDELSVAKRKIGTLYVPSSPLPKSLRE